MFSQTMSRWEISQHISGSLIDHAGLYLGQINWKKWVSTQN